MAIDAAPAPRLLVVSSYFDTHKGGLELVAGRLAQELASRGFEVTWLATAAVPPSPSHDLQTVPVGAWNVTERRLGIPFPIPSPAALARLWGAVKAADAVMLHDSLYPLSVATAIAARLTRTPLLVIQHIGQVRYRHALPRILMAIGNAMVARPVLAAADQVVFISHFVRDFFARVRFRAEPQIVFNGVDTEVFAPGDRAKARKALGLDQASPLALFVGRFVEKKGLHLLEQAARARPDVTFAFAGWGHLDPETWGLTNVSVFRGLSGRELAPLYQAADVFVLPSVGEGFPLVVQEALASGLPVICGAEATTADPAASAELAGVEVEAPDALARLLGALDSVLSAKAKPADAARRRRLVEERYAWSAGADRYAALLRELIQYRASASSKAVAGAMTSRAA
jgi:glycosyltransferase involved in cell wall biosynthesis